MISTFERLSAMMVKDYQIPAGSLTMQSDLESLGIDSLGVAEMLFAIEDEFRVTLPPEPAELITVGDVVNYIDALVAGRRPVSLGGAERKTGQVAAPAYGFAAGPESVRRGPVALP